MARPGPARSDMAPSGTGRANSTPGHRHGQAHSLHRSNLKLNARSPWGAFLAGANHNDSERDSESSRARERSRSSLELPSPAAGIEQKELMHVDSRCKIKIPS